MPRLEHTAVEAPPCIITEDLDTGRGLLASRDFAAGTEVFSFADAQTVEIGIFSVQISRSTHVWHPVLENLNHSCKPNVRLDTSRLALAALHDIKAGEELTFFYPSTEWVMYRPFPCKCGTEGCIGLVRGARDIPRSVLMRYSLTTHISNLLLEQCG